MGEGGAANQCIQDGQGLKSSLQSRCSGGGAIQDVQQAHLHKFYQQIGAPKEPFLPGLATHLAYLASHLISLLCA
jgi:hypothetical protein